MHDPVIVRPATDKFSKAEMARWGQYVGVRRTFPFNDNHYEDMWVLVYSLRSADAIAHFRQHGFEYKGKLAFNVSPDGAPAWLIKFSLFLGFLFGAS
jgi:hypothetical protein